MTQHLFLTESTRLPATSATAPGPPHPELGRSASMPSFAGGMMCAGSSTARNKGIAHANGGRIDSPDNDSAFSDNASMLSSESSASSNNERLRLQQQQHQHHMMKVINESSAFIFEIVRIVCTRSGKR